MDRGAWRATVHGGHKESDMIERLTHTLTGPNKSESTFYQDPQVVPVHSKV